MEIFTLLVFDVFLEELIGDRTTADRAVSTCPEMSSPEDFGDAWAIGEECMGTLVLDVLHHVADGQFRRVGDEQMDMIRSNLPGQDGDVNL